MQNSQELSSSNNTAFSLLYNTYHKKMYAYGIAMGFCQHICNDAVHDVFSSLYFSKKTLDHIENLEIYLMRSMKNRLFDIYKEERRKHSVDYECCLNNNEEGIVDKLIAEENNRLMKEEVSRLLKKLPPKHRQIILFRFNHNLKYNEIATIMGMTSDAVKKQMYRILKLLEQEIRSTPTCYYNVY